MTVVDTEFSGLKYYHQQPKYDKRGLLQKTYQMSQLEGVVDMAAIREEYYTRSTRNVVRGMHFQRPPHDHMKLVYCASGAVLDVVLDLRTAAPTFGRYFSLELNEENGRVLVIPSGFAHGFLALSDCLMVYKVSSEYSAESDGGLCWNSFGFPWPVVDPTISDRDAALPKFLEFRSPF